MQIAAMSPLVVAARSWSRRRTVDKQRRDLPGAAQGGGRAGGGGKPEGPEAAWPKVIDGKITKWFTEVTLLGQDNVWEQPAQALSTKVRQELGKQLGGEVKVNGFVRFGLGEGIEKKVENLADEVAKTIGG